MMTLISNLEDLSLDEIETNLIKEYEKEKLICVFCGSGLGNKIEYEQAAKDLGKLIVSRGYGLVYGGGSGGLMGAVAKSVAELNGTVLSIYPKGLRGFCEVNFSSKNIMVKDMHQRKKLFAKLSIGFLALPGGIGTFEEVMEMATWNHLGIHKKFLGLVDTLNFYQPMKALLDHAVNEQFLKPEARDLISINSNPDILLNLLEQYDPKYSMGLNWN